MVHEYGTQKDYKTGLYFFLIFDLHEDGEEYTIHESEPKYPASEAAENAAEEWIAKDRLEHPEDYK